MKSMKSFTGYFLFILVLNTSSSLPQVTGWVENFNDGNISSWEVIPEHQRTFKLSAENGSLKIAYTRTSSSDPWDNIHFTPNSSIDLSNNKLISIRIKSDVNTQLTLKPVYEDGKNDWVQSSLIGDNSWHTVQFKIANSTNMKMYVMYLYLDGGTTLPKSGSVWFDEVAFGDSAGTAAVEWGECDKAISLTEALLQNALEGNAEGEFPYGTKANLQSSLLNAESIRNSGTKDQKVADQAVLNLYDACSTFEANVNAVQINLVDNRTTKETRYLYLNLKALTQRALLFGMQDVTGYGVGWSGDDDRGDVKDVCGDFPAVFNEDMNQVERGWSIDRVKYRLTSAYNGGAVISMVWHQYDPGNRSFYAADVNNEQIVKQLIPGGTQHNYYKEKLKTIASFLKSLRGKNGESIPVIFRPYHEHLGNWFWWGTPHWASVDEFNSLWRFTVGYLRDSLNVHNLMWIISPPADQIRSGNSYFNVYPGDAYLDLFGGDYYFGSTVTDNDRNTFLQCLQAIGRGAVSRNKLAALTEVGQEALPTKDWFTNVLFPPLKNDSIASNLVYASVWRNASTTHHYAPYPGHPSVPDFIKFYDDPYTLFQHDLPPMYKFPEEDKTPPVFLVSNDSMFLATSVPASIGFSTNERAFVKYSFQDESYQAMPFSFQYGEGGYSHSTSIALVQGETKTIYLKAKDIFGNESTQSKIISVLVDTMQAPIAWTDYRYPVKDWKSGITPIGSGATAATKIQSVRTGYFVRTINLDEDPELMAMVIKGQSGAVVYVNNSEIKRINMLEKTPINYDSDPTASGLFTKTITLDTASLNRFHKGENLVAIEVHGTPQLPVDGFNFKLFTQNGTIIPFNSDWSYYAEGNKPSDIKLSDINLVAYSGSELPKKFTLYGNYPNPFNPTTTIRYDLSNSADVTVEVFNMLGQRVTTLVNEYQNAGRYEVRFNASNLASGIYTVQVRSSSFAKSHKMMLVK